MRITVTKSSKTSIIFSAPVSVSVSVSVSHPHTPPSSAALNIPVLSCGVKLSSVCTYKALLVSVYKECLGLSMAASIRIGSHFGCNYSKHKPRYVILQAKNKALILIVQNRSLYIPSLQICFRLTWPISRVSAFPLSTGVYSFGVASRFSFGSLAFCSGHFLLWGHVQNYSRRLFSVSLFYEKELWKKKIFYTKDRH